MRKVFTKVLYKIFRAERKTERSEVCSRSVQRCWNVYFDALSAQVFIPFIDLGRAEDGDSGHRLNSQEVDILSSAMIRAPSFSSRRREAGFFTVVAVTL